MRIAKKMVRVALAGLLGLAVVPGLTRAAAPTERVLPGSTLLYVQVPDANVLGDAVRSSQLGRLFKDPAMDPLKADLREKLQGFGSQVEEQTGLSLVEILTLPEGEVALAVVGTAEGARPVGVYVTAEAGANAEKMDQLMVRATELSKERGVTARDEEFQGTTLHVLQRGEEPPVVWTKQGTVYHYATDLDLLKDFLTNAEGREDSLAAKESYQKVRAQSGEESQLFWYLDIAGSIDLVNQIMKSQGAANAQQIQDVLALTGLNALQAIGGGLAFNVGPYDQFGRVYLYAPGEPTGLIPLFQLPRANLTPEPWVPANVASYQTISWDLDAAYEALKTFTDQFAQGMLEGFEQQIAGPQGEGLKFQRDLFGPLGDRISVVSDFETPGDENTQRVLVGVALEDAETFRGTLDKILGMIGLAPKSRELAGTTIYEFEIPQVPNAEAAGLRGPISVAIARETLFLSTSGTLLEQALGASGPGLAQSPAYQAVAQHYPAATSTLSFTRPEEQARVLYNMVKSGRLGQAIRQGAQGAGGELPEEDLIDPAKIPAFEVFAKYISQGGGYGVMEPDGVTFTQFTLKKEAP